MKKFNIYYVKKRVFDIYTDIFPKLNTLYLIIRCKLRIQSIIYAIQQMKQNIYISIYTNIKDIYTIFKINILQSYRIKINFYPIYKVKFIINSVINIQQKIVSETRLIVSQKQLVGISTNMEYIIRCMISMAQNIHPFKIKINTSMLYQPTIGLFRKLMNLGYTTQQSDYYFDLPLWQIDNSTLFYLDVQDDYWVYWGCSPYNYQGLYELNNFGSDNVKKQGETWRINRNTKIYLAQNSVQQNYNYIQQQDISFISQIDQLYKISITIQDISTSQNSILCNILKTLNTEPSGQEEGIYLSSGTIYIYILQQRFSQQPQQEQIYSWMIQNNFKMLIPLQHTQTTTIYDNDTIQSLNNGRLELISGKISYTNGIENQNPDNPLIFFGYGEMQFITTS